MHDRLIEPLETRRLLALVIDYPMEEGSGTTVHDVASDFMPQDAELSGGARWIDTDGQTLRGQHGIELDGVDDELFISDDISHVLGIGGASVTAWIKTTAVGGATPQESPGLIGSAYDGTSIYWGWIDNCGRINFSVPGGTPEGGRDTVTSEFPVNDGRWYHIGMTRDVASGEIRLYVNGLLRDSALADPSPRDVFPMRRVGVIREWDTARPDRFLDASIDQVRIYDEALSATDVAHDFEPRGVLPPTPTNVRVVLQGDRSIRLRWDHVAGVSGYEVWRSLPGETDFEMVALAPPNGEYTDTGLERQTSYAYRIRAINPFGASGFSQTVDGTTSTAHWLPKLLVRGTAAADEIRVEVRGNEVHVWNSGGCCAGTYRVEPFGEYDGIWIESLGGDDKIYVSADNGYVINEQILIDAGAGRDDVQVTGRSLFSVFPDSSHDDLTLGGHARAAVWQDSQFGSWTFDGPGAVYFDRGIVGVRSITRHDGARIEIGAGTLRLLDSPERDVMIRRLEAMAVIGRAGTPPWSGDAGLTSHLVKTPLMGIGVGFDTKATYNGDVDLDGRINADDYFAIDAGFLAQPPDPLYGQGDFNYDGKINADDYFLIDSSFVGQAPSTALLASVRTSVRASDAGNTVMRKATSVRDPVQTTKRRRAGIVLSGRQEGR